MIASNISAQWTLLPDARPIEDGVWLWPLAALPHIAPSIVGHAHGERHGIDLGYASELASCRVAVHAAQGGTISYAQRTKSGYAISIEHGHAWSTHYAKLSEMCVAPATGHGRYRARVRAGDIIGYAQIYFRFELWAWTDAHGFVPIEPALRMRDWRVIGPTTTDQAAA